MTEQEIKQMIDQISDFILERFGEKEVTTPEALTVLSLITEGIIEALCIVIDEDADGMIDLFCNGLQQHKKKRHTFTTGSYRNDRMLTKIVEEVRAGGNIEKIVDKYVDCDDSKLRKKIIDGLHEIRDKHIIDNIDIGYEA